MTLLGFKLFGLKSYFYTLIYCFIMIYLRLFIYFYLLIPLRFLIYLPWTINFILSYVFN